MKFETILVPLDGSPLAELALPAAADLARSADGQILLVRAVQAHNLSGVDWTDAQVRAVREAEEYLADVASRLRAAGAATVETSVWYGAPAYSVVEAVRLYGADLIVMCTHGRSGLSRLILGSVAESVVRESRTPVLLVRPPGAAAASAETEGATRSAHAVGS